MLGRQSALHNAFLDAALFVETGLESALYDEVLFAGFAVCVSAGVKVKAPATIDATAVSSNLFMSNSPENRFQPSWEPAPRDIPQSQSYPEVANMQA